MPGELIPIILFICIVLIVKIVSDNALKRRLIEKDMVKEDVKYLLGTSYDAHVPAALKWGMVCVAIGAAILLGEILEPFDSEAGTFAGMFLFGGAALIIYYFIAKNKVEAEKDKIKTK
ncbi:hypothetical protein JW935_15345 [candidate division KSB1 bacterium]|nr:hypothetical protein [candidate division KSB1 bacterium]